MITALIVYTIFIFMFLAFNKADVKEIVVEATEELEMSLGVAYTLTFLIVWIVFPVLLIETGLKKLK